MTGMTPKERIRATLDHREPDRLAIDFGGQNTSIHLFAHRDLLRHLELEPGEERLRSYFNYIADPDPRLIKRFGRDVIPFFAKAASGWELRIDPETNRFVDEWGTTFHMPPGGYYYDATEFPLANAETLEDLDRYRWPDPRDPVRTEGLAEAVKAAYQEGEKALLMASLRLGIWTQAWVLRGLEQSFMDMVANPKLAEAVAERTMEWQMAYWDAVLAQVGQYLDLVHLEGDLGSTEGPLFSPAIFRRIHKPRFAKLIAFIKARTSAKVFLHSCGSVYWAIPDLIECGVDVLNPVQVNARDMDSARLKREFGKDLTFWGGGCDPVVLGNGTTQEVETDVRRRIEDLAPGGGFVFGSVHNIQPHTPPQNIVTMYETARKYGGYDD